MAAEEVPKDKAGRFVLHDGTVFQSYLLPDSISTTAVANISSGCDEDLIPTIDIIL